MRIARPDDSKTWMHLTGLLVENVCDIASRLTSRKAHGEHAAEADAGSLGSLNGPVGDHRSFFKT